MNLTRLVYYSQRSSSEDLDVKSLIETCKRNNQKSNLTGFLHHNRDHFVQVIEGGRVDVSATLQRIAQDPRHTNIILLSFADVHERLFAKTAMGIHEGMDDHARGLFLRYFASERLDPETVNVEALLDVMQDLAVEAPQRLTISV